MVTVWWFETVFKIRVGPRVTNVYWVNPAFNTCWLHLHINPLVHEHCNQTRHIFRHILLSRLD